MKKDIHPTVKEDVKVTCACGNTFLAQSTADDISVDICNQCHPFYTGKQKFVDTEGRIDKFHKKVELAKQKAEKSKGKKKSQEKQVTTEKPKTLKEMLNEAKEQA